MKRCQLPQGLVHDAAETAAAKSYMYNTADVIVVHMESAPAIERSGDTQMLSHAPVIAQ
jgi:hypothetical protein